jgi:putative Mn2+ efflux pump MntP
MKGLKLFGIALSVAAVSVAFASGWTVSVSTSNGTLFGPSVATVQTNVPFIINTSGQLFSPATVVVNTLPQVTFLTALGNPNPILSDAAKDRAPPTKRRGVSLTPPAESG